jgi:hypothetical protein
MVSLMHQISIAWVNLITIHYEYPHRSNWMFFKFYCSVFSDNCYAALRATIIEGKGECNPDKLASYQNIMRSLWEELSAIADFDKVWKSHLNSFKTWAQIRWEWLRRDWRLMNKKYQNTSRFKVYLNKPHTSWVF